MTYPRVSAMVPMPPQKWRKMDWYMNPFHTLLTERLVIPFSPNFKHASQSNFYDSRFDLDLKRGHQFNG